MDADKLNALGSMTQETDAENPDPQQQAEQARQAQAEQASVQAARQWGMLMFTLGGFAQMIAPELKPVYSQERCMEWGEQANAVAEKYGWTGPAAMPELALIASTAGFAVPTYLVIRQKLEQAKAAKDGSVAEKVAAWWHNRKARKAGAAAAAAVPGGDVVAEVGPDGRQP